MNIERIRQLVDAALRNEDRTGVAWVTGMEVFDSLVRDAERYRGLRAAAMEERTHVKQELDHVATCHLPHEKANTIAKFDENTDAFVEAFKRIAARQA